MNSTREKTIQYTQKLQRQMDVPLWSIADESIIFSIAQNKTIQFGKKTQELYLLMKFFSNFRLSDFLIFLVGFLNLIKLNRNGKKYKINHSKFSQIKNIFVGFGANSEKILFEQVDRKLSEKPYYINWTTGEGIGNLGYKKFFQALLVLLKNSFGFSYKLKVSIPEISNHKTAFMTVCSKNIAVFSFSSVFWEIAKANGVNEVFFIMPEISTFSCVEKKLKSSITSHGLICASIVIPSINILTVLTEAEKIYFSRILKNTRVEKTVSIIQKHKTNSSVGMILSVNTFIHERINTIQPFVDFLRNANIKIIFRPTVQISHEEKYLLKNVFPDCQFDDINRSFSESMEILQPIFVAAWTSSCLAMAVENKFLAISFNQGVSTDLAWNMIYPLEEKVLFWPRDKDTLRDLLIAKKQANLIFTKA